MHDYVLWLPSWYPNQLTPFDGDFIQRHARAAALFIPVHVIHVIRDASGAVTRTLHIEERKEGNLTETIVYYFVPHSPVPGYEKWISFLRYRELYRQVCRQVFEKRGKPMLSHVHIAYKAGLMAAELYAKHQIPYLVTEQWTGYLPEAQDNYAQRSFFEKRYFNRIIRNAKAILPVSAYLANAMKQYWPGQEYHIVPNVVDHAVFQPQQEAKEPGLRLIHISNLNYQKDPQSLLKAMQLLKLQGLRFRLDILGPEVPEVVALAQRYELDDHVFFHGEVPHSILVRFIQRSNLLILYSRYETFGCVLIEAMACGIPVLVAETALMHEIVTEGVTGTFVAPLADAESLARAIIGFQEKQGAFDPVQIQAQTLRYSFPAVGRQLLEYYQRFGNSSNPI